MNSIDIFKGLRIQEFEGNVLINLEDISIGLGFTQIKNDKVYIRKETVSKYLDEFGFPTRWENETMVTESVFYLLAMKANNEIAKKFQVKVATEIIPEYRKSKQHNLPQTFSEALRLLADTTDQKEKAVIQLNIANETIEENKPKVVFADSVIGSSNSILIRQFAKDLCDTDFKIGQNRLFLWFRENKYLMNDNSPYQNYVDMGLFEVITRSIGSGSETFTSKTTKVTGKGAVYFAKKIKSSNVA